MSWFDDLTSGIVSLFSGISTVGGLVSAAITGYSLYKLNQSIDKTSAAGAAANEATTHTVIATDFGNLNTIPADQNNKIPVLYGTAYVPGFITEAVMSADRQTMTYVITICEKTGDKLSGGTSSITFLELLWNKNTVNLAADGVTALSTTDADGNVDTNIANLVQFYCYNDGSSGYTSPQGYSAGAHWAFQQVPNWDPTYTMDHLVFCVVRVKYDKTKGVVGIPSMSFKLSNSMSKPGDCMYDYMTNTRYGCGISPSDIYT